MTPSSPGDTAQESVTLVSPIVFTAKLSGVPIEAEKKTSFIYSRTINSQTVILVQHDTSIH